MLKTILKLNGVQKLSKENLKEVTAGNWFNWHGYLIYCASSTPPLHDPCRSGVCMVPVELCGGQ